MERSAIREPADIALETRISLRFIRATKQSVTFWIA
jgi:hypothetical protein